MRPVVFHELVGHPSEKSNVCPVQQIRIIIVQLVVGGDRNRMVGETVEADIYR